MYRTIISLFSIILVLNGCNTSTEPRDCAGIQGGGAYIDDCGQCVGGTTGSLENYLMDCAGVCGGDAILDDCGCVAGSTGLEEDWCFGCTDPNAQNFDDTATLNDGSCIYENIPGCTDEFACNFNPGALTNDGSCLYLDCNDECGGTAQFDECGICCAGSTGIECSFYIDESNFGGIFDCNGDCDGSAQILCGVCCDGNTGYNCEDVNENIDCAGVCFGDAYINECGCVGGITGLEIDFCYGCTDPIASNYDPLATINDGSCMYYGEVTDIDGNAYSTVAIGNQAWFIENLHVTHYQNGDEIPYITDDTEWHDTWSDAYCYYADDPSIIQDYGILYNWYAASDERNVCPDGWHVPSDAEWQELVDLYGGYAFAGGPLKATGTIEEGDGLWFSPNNGATNESGFSAIPGGSRNHDGYYDNIGFRGNYWTSTGYGGGTSAYLWQFYNTGISLNRSNHARQEGFSIRCISGDPDISGCTDPAAWNYNLYANIENGSCEYSDLFDFDLVEAGSFTHGSEDEIQNIPYSYGIMRYEVTNAQYADYLNSALNDGLLTVSESSVSGFFEGSSHLDAGSYEYLNLDDSNCHIDWVNDIFAAQFEYSEHPVILVTWYGATAFADYYGLELPSEQEWEKAARGLSGWDYPWGNETPTCEYANYAGCYFGTTPVDSFPLGQSVYGAFDLAGNVWEWTSTDDDDELRMRIRGGSWNYSVYGLYSWFNGDGQAALSWNDVGFRCIMVLN